MNNPKFRNVGFWIDSFDWMMPKLTELDVVCNKMKTLLFGVEIFFVFNFVRHNKLRILIVMLFVWRMEHCYSEDLFSDYKLSTGKTFSSNGWISHGRNHLLVMNAEKNIFKEKNRRKNYETLLTFSQRWENIHCKIIHRKITFFNNIFGHLELFSGLTTRNSISDWFTDMLIHLPFRFHSSSLLFVIIQLFILRHSVSE